MFVAKCKLETLTSGTPGSRAPFISLARMRLDSAGIARAVNLVVSLSCGMSARRRGAYPRKKAYGAAVTPSGCIGHIVLEIQVATKEVSRPKETYVFLSKEIQENHSPNLINR